MSFENCVYLVKGLPMEHTDGVEDDVPGSGHILITGSLITVARHPDFIDVGDGPSSYFEKIRAYTQQFKEDEDLLLLGLSLGPRTAQAVNVFLCLDVLMELCDLLPKPFFRFLFTVKSPSRDYVTMYQRQLDFSDGEILAVNEWTTLLSPKPFLSSSTTTCDIILCWVEPGPATATALPELKPIRLSPDCLLEKLSLHSREESKELVILAGNGAEIKCHRVIFEAHSDVLAVMVSPGNGMKESKTGVIKMEDSSEEGLSRLIKYMYGLELTTNDLSADVAIELLSTAHKYKLVELQNALEELLMKMGKDWFTPDDILDLHFYVRNLDEFTGLKEHSLAIMLSLQKEIRGCQRFKELKRTDAEAAIELMGQLLDMDK